MSPRQSGIGEVGYENFDAPSFAQFQSLHPETDPRRICIHRDPQIDERVTFAKSICPTNRTRMTQHLMVCIGRFEMVKFMQYVRVSCLSASLFFVLHSSPVLAGGNGNGGNGSGGAHGAATSGMTFHSEPVSSPWNRVPGDLTRTTDASATSLQQTTSDDKGMLRKASN